MTNGAVLAITKKGNRYLLGVETKKTPIEGMHRFLGGGVNEDESPLEAVVRELQEEASIAVRVTEGDKLCEVQRDYDSVDVRIHVYLAEWVSGEPRAQDGEISNLAWYSKHGMINQNLTPLCRRILEENWDRI